MLSQLIRALSQRARRIAKFATLATIVTSTLVGAMAFGGTAIASAAYINSNSGAANVRTCGSVNCEIVRRLGNGTGVHMVAWCDSEWVYPPSSNYASPRWFKINSPVSGWVHSSLVAAQQSVGHNCYA